MKKLFTLMLMSICMVLTANAGQIYLIGSDGTWDPDHASATLPETSTAGVYEAEVNITSNWFSVVKNLASAGDWDTLNSAENRFAASNFSVGEECRLDKKGGDVSINLETTGKYKVTVNLNSMTIKLVLVEEAADKYYVAGVDALGLDWTGKNEDLLMTTTDKTTYTFTKENLTLESGIEYGFKVVKNGSTWIPGGDNITIKVTETGKYTVTFTYVVGKSAPTATATKTGNAEATKHTYTVYGNFEGEESWKDFNMTESPEGTWTAVITGVAAGTYKFKVRADEEWNIEYPKGQGNNETVTVAKDNTTVTIVYVENPQGITVTQTVPTAIDRVNADIENAPAYNLAGMKANKGFVIKNNKKYILR